MSFQHRRGGKGVQNIYTMGVMVIYLHCAMSEWKGIDRYHSVYFQFSMY